MASVVGVDVHDRQLFYYGLQVNCCEFVITIANSIDFLSKKYINNSNCRRLHEMQNIFPTTLGHAP